MSNAFDVVLMASFCVALIGLGFIGLLVPKPTLGTQSPSASASLKLALALWKRTSFRGILIVGAILAMMTASDGFIYLVLQKNTGSSAALFPLFAFITALFYLVLSVPAGKLADRYGRRRIFLDGYVLMICIYSVLLAPGVGEVTQFAVLGLLGTYYAATDGVLAAAASSVLPPDLRTSGLATLNTATSLFKVASSALFGWLWVSQTMTSSVYVFLAGLTVALATATMIFRKNPIHAH